MSQLTPLEDALAQVLAAARPLQETERVPLISALGRVLAETAVSTVDVPPVDNSAMDGYALRAEDAGTSLPVVQRIPAGAFAQPHQPGTAARIFTGAPVPHGADCVAMQEDCVEKAGSVSINAAVAAGDNVRPQGQDVAVGATALSAGRRLRPQDLGLLASLGLQEVAVFRRLRVAVLSTGDELVEPGDQGAPEGAIFNSNRYTLAGLLQGLGMEFVDGGIVADSPQATAEALFWGAANADVVITSGGVSVGEEDHVKAQVERLGELGLWKLAIKPGKPLAFGRVEQTPFIGLPGNPTSVFVTFCLVARPFLLAVQGATDGPLPRLQARAGFSVGRPGRRQDYVRVQLSRDEHGLVAARVSNQSSGVLSSVSHNNALAVVPPGQAVAEGDPIDVLLLDVLTGL